jgi:hypothetical protein
VLSQSRGEARSCRVPTQATGAPRATEDRSGNRTQPRTDEGQAVTQEVVKDFEARSGVAQGPAARPTPAEIASTFRGHEWN